MRPSIYPLLSRNFRIRLVTTLGLFGCLALTQVAIGQSTIAQQDFDGGTPEWEYSSNVPFFDNGWDSDGRFDVVPNSEWGGSSPDLNYSNLSGKILGINDLDDTDGSTSNGTKETAKVTFEKVNISGYKNVDVTFDYDLDGSGSSKWNNDFLKYQVFEDGVGQGVVTIANGSTKEGTETVNISSGTNHVKLAFRIKQNSESDYGGIDNIKLEGNTKSQSEPANQPSNFSANALSNGKIELTWSDASNTPEPNGYLIKATDQSTSISAPSDGTDPSIDKDLSDGSAVVKVGHGTGGSFTFDGLNRDTKYDFQIWSFTNAESNIDFLTSTAGPSLSATTSENENLLTESFESTSGYTYPKGNGGSGNDFFDRTDIIDYPPTTDHIYSGFDQSYFIAGEDIDGVSSTNSDDGQVKISNIDITGYQNLKVKGLLAAGANSGYESGDGIEVEVRVDNGNWTTIADFKGNTNDSLQEDSDLDGTPDGTILDGSFKDFVWDVSQTGDQMAVRVTMSFNANSEEAAFDNIRVSGKAPKKWNGGTSGDWSTGGNWEPSGVPESDDIVVLDNTHVQNPSNNKYTVNIDQSLSNTSIQSLKILPASGQSIDAVRKSGLSTFKLTGSGTVLTIGSGGIFTDKSSAGLPTNFDNGNGRMLIKSGGTYHVQNSSGFSTSNLVGQISSSSSSVGEVIIESAGQAIAASGRTYPTGLTLKNNTGSSVSYTTSGSSAFTIEGDLTIGSNVTYDATGRSSGGDLIVKGDFTVNGTLNMSSQQALKMPGSGSQQTIKALSSLPSLTVNNSSGVQLNQTLTVNDTLNLTNGNVTFQDSSDKLIIADGATVSGASQSSYVDGTVRKIGDEAFDFPVGANGNYAKIGISAPANSSDTFEATYFAKGPGFSSLAGSGKNPAGEVLQKVSQNQFWDLERGKNSSSAVDVTLYWSNQTNGGIQNKSSLAVAHETTISGTPKWENLGKDSTNGSATGTGSITKNNVNNFSDFTYGSTNNNNGLPVELLYFKAAAVQGHADLTWATASETNNKHFQVQKQVEGAWENIGTVKGHGTTIEKQTYNFQDPDVKAGQTYYYRLKQVDFDGSYAYSDVKAVTLDGRASSAVSIHPNPVSAQLHLTVNTKTSRNMEVVIQNIYGQQVYRGAMTTQAGANEQTLPVSQLSPGQYVIQLRGDERVVQKRFIKQ